MITQCISPIRICEYLPRVIRPISVRPTCLSRYFQWHDILQVIVPRGNSLSPASREQTVSADDVLSCPICLSPPTAPRMTKCGHVRRHHILVSVLFDLTVGILGLLLSMHSPPTKHLGAAQMGQVSHLLRLGQRAAAQSCQMVGRDSRAGDRGGSCRRLFFIGLSHTRICDYIANASYSAATDNDARVTSVIHLALRPPTPSSGTVPLSA